MLRVETQAPANWAAARLTHLPLLQIADDGQAITTPAAWEQRKAELMAAWHQYLGSAPFSADSLTPAVRRTTEQDIGFGTAEVVYLQTEPGYWEQCLLMIPKMPAAGDPGRRLPAMVVFYYDIDTPAGIYMGSPRWKGSDPTRAYAQALVQRGYVVLVQRWFCEGYISTFKFEAQGPSLSGRYAQAVARFKSVAPFWKGLGRVVWDAGRCVDFLQTLPMVDPGRIGCMGHSLGGKMALYAGAFDPRFQVVISSDLGIGLSFSNWEDPWYLGPEAKKPGFPLDHHQLLAFIAPRPYLLIAGQYDGEKSWPYINSAQDVYRLYGAAERIGMINHATGHAPTLEALALAYAWCDRYLNAM
ncbi:MAG TPA: hypothetical protein GXX29_06050 [Firmicutes bacterium]|nr:hypothetical protein [Bacillota bacterium]